MGDPEPSATRLAKGGAQGRSRTTDTAIFSRMLYQLSYLGKTDRERDRKPRPYRKSA